MPESKHAARLDVYDKHLKLLGFYHHLGYQERGAFRLMTKRYGETGGICFEKPL